MLPPIFQRPLWTGVAGVSSAHPLATKAGLNILKAGGNAVDAAVAVSAALNVVEFYHTSLAGGGFGLLYWAETGETMAIDFRGCAPKKATRDMFLGRLEDAAEGPQAVLVPGLLRGLGQIHSRYGRTSWDQLWVDAIEIAEEGFYLGPAYASITEFGIKKGRATRFEETARTFLDKGRPYGAGKPFRQRELAQVMRTIQTEGPEGFYSGWVAERFLEGLDSLGGIITADDLVDYRSSITPAVQGIYQDVTCHTPGLPCGGGLQIIMMLNILEQFDLKALGYSADYFQLLLQALEVGFAHRLEYFGDPRFVDDPTERLLSKEYARSLSLEGPMASGSSRPTGQGGTTHFVVADAEGNVVSWTQT
ncbi:MAG: gamma-glutamyltransferase, partial [Limnochordia bacterium]